MHPERYVRNVTTNVLLVKMVKNVLNVLKEEMVINVSAQTDIMITRKKIQNVINVISNVRHVQEQLIIVRNVLETERVHLNVNVHQEP
jgi:hypothetical protein